MLIEFTQMHHISSIHTSGTFDFQISISPEGHNDIFSPVFGARHSLATFRATPTDNEFSVEAYDLNAQAVAIIVLGDVNLQDIEVELRGCSVVPNGKSRLAICLSI